MLIEMNINLSIAESSMAGFMSPVHMVWMVNKTIKIAADPVKRTAKKRSILFMILSFVKVQVSLTLSVREIFI